MRPPVVGSSQVTVFGCSPQLPILKDPVANAVFTFSLCAMVVKKSCLSTPLHLFAAWAVPDPTLFSWHRSLALLFSRSFLGDDDDGESLCTLQARRLVTLGLLT